jgi:hypothetical protein
MGWADAAGYVIAESDRPPAWRWAFRDSHDFVLRPNELLVRAAEYA